MENLIPFIFYCKLGRWSRFHLESNIGQRLNKERERKVWTKGTEIIVQKLRPECIAITGGGEVRKARPAGFYNFALGILKYRMISVKEC